MTAVRLDRRHALALGFAALAAPAAAASPTTGQRLARAARAQVGVTLAYDPAYAKLAYPGGDVPRSRGVCTDVVVRAARDALNLDLQTLVHGDMSRAFAAYPSRRLWGLTRPDPNIDHRRVPNLETFWRRRGAEVWKAASATPGFAFPDVRPGDIVTWTLAGGRDHVGLVTAGGLLPRIVHNIGGGAKEEPLALMAPHRARALYRWPGEAAG